MIGEMIAQLPTRDSAGADKCVADDGFCPSWIVDNFGDYMTPLVEHIVLTFATIVIGFAISFVLAIYAHRHRWLIGPVTGVTGALYTVPSIAAFVLLLPITGRGNTTALVALVAYSLLILFRNISVGLDSVPRDVIDAAKGMGLTDNQVLWRVELPLAVPEIFAGLRIAVTTTIGLVALAFLAGAGGLGAQISNQITFKSNVVTAGGLCVLLAAVSDLVLLGAQRLATPWMRAQAS